MKYAKPIILSSFKASERIQGLHKGAPFVQDNITMAPNTGTTAAYEADE